MKALVIFAFVGVTFTGVGLWRTFNVKITVDPIRVMNPTYFSNPAEIGAVVFRRYWAEINRLPVVVLASSPHLKNYDGVWRGFLAAAETSGVKFTKIYNQKGLRPLTESAIEIENIDLENLKRLQGEGEKILVHTVTSEQWLSSLALTSPASSISKEALLVVQNLLPVSEENKVLLRATCDEKNPSPQMSCQALTALSRGKRKKVTLGRWSALIEKMPMGELLLIQESHL